jgi:hypothetical protein
MYISLSYLRSIVIYSLFLAILPMPYFYYMYVRLLVFIVAIIFLNRIIKLTMLEKALLILSVIFYNPLLVIHLNKVIWIIINTLTVGLFWYLKPKVDT